MMRAPTALALILTALLAGCDGDAGGDGPYDAPALPKGPRTVVLISLDTLRPDRLGLYGGAPEVSPVMDSLGPEAVVFDQAVAPAPWTLPSHMTMLTGLDPVAHGVINHGQRLSPDVTTLAEALQAAGYTTGAFTDGGFVSAKYGFDQGFDHYDDTRASLPGEVDGFPRSMPRALDWLAQHYAKDLFLFLHTFDAHTPYDEVAPDILEQFRARPTPDGDDDHALHALSYLFKQGHVGVTDYPRMANLLNDYDAGVHEADLWLGRLRESLQQQGRWDGALIIITSDHGESFYDHGLHVGHGLTLLNDELSIPLIVKLPVGEGGGRRFDDLVSLVDIARTVLEVEGLESTPMAQGESLLGLVRGRERALTHVLGASSNIRAGVLITPEYKYITPVGVKPLLIAERHLGPISPPSLMGPRAETCYEMLEQDLCYDMASDPLGLLDVLPSSEELYDRRSDPGEAVNLARKRISDDEPEPDPEVVATLRRMARDYSKLRGESAALGFTSEDVKVDAADLRVLATLGYLENGNRDDLSGVSLTMQEWVLHPHRAPDTAALLAGDRAVHRARLKLQSGVALDAVDQRVLWAAGDGWLSWLGKNAAYVSRVDWRLAELLELGERAGLELPATRWKQSLGSAGQ